MSKADNDAQLRLRLALPNGARRRPTGLPCLRMARRLRRNRRVCRNQDPHQQVEQQTGSGAQRQQPEQQAPDPTLDTADACDAAAHAAQPAVVAAAAQRIDRHQGWRVDIWSTTENARLGAREFLIREHAALVQRTQSTQLFAQTHDASPAYRRYRGTE